MMNINRVTIAIFRTENPCVPGSIPGDTTSESESCSNVTLFFVLFWSLFQGCVSHIHCPHLPASTDICTALPQYTLPKPFSTNTSRELSNGRIENSSKFVIFATLTCRQRKYRTIWRHKLIESSLTL